MNEQNIKELLILASHYTEAATQFNATPAGYSRVERALELLVQAKALMELNPVMCKVD
jgi:hypothetical protein